MVGWDDDDFHSQVVCPGEDNVSIMCSNLPGGMFKYYYVNVCILDHTILIRNEYKISHFKVLQRTTPSRLDAIAF